MLQRFKDKYIGDRAFYSYVLGLAIPMILQNVVTNAVSLLDNVMVGQIGTEQMSGVAIANQFIFVFNVTIFGAVSGPGIFGAQFYGKGDHKGQMHTFRFRLIIASLLTVLAGLLFYYKDTELISLYLHDGQAGDITLALNYGREYLRIMLIALLPFAIGQTYSSVVRECGETKIPMIATFSAVLINLTLDYGLIFGKLGMPKLGVKGAAIATVIAKSIESLVVIIWAHTHAERNKYIEGVYRSLYIPGTLAKQMIAKGIPLLANEFLWSAGMAVVTQCYALRGLDVVASQNIAGTITNLFGVVHLQLGASIAIIVGQKLGAGRLDEAKDADNKMLALSVGICAVMSVLLMPVAKVFPQIYNTQDEIKALASFFIMIQALVMPLWAYSNAAYFTLRSGGKTGITFLFDSVFTWCIMIPTVFILAKFSTLDIRAVFVITTYTEIAKVICGYFMIKSNKWMVNLTNI